jgi:RES domain
VTSSVVDDGDALPEPPADIATRKLPLTARPAGTRYARIHRAADGPVWFGWNHVAAAFRPPTNRFDAPDRSYGVLYAAVTRDGSFAETIGRKPGIFRSSDELAGLAMTTLALTRELRLVDLHGGAAVGALGATGVVGVGPQSLARRWSKALHAHPEMPDGIEYRCRHNSDEIAVALFDRVGEASLVSIGVVSLVSDLVWLNTMRTQHRILEPPT